MDLPKIKAFLIERHYPDYRLRQIQKNYLSAKFKNFLEMSDLPLNLRQELATNFTYSSVTQSKLMVGDSSQKAVLKLVDGLQIETVIMDYGDWITACVSTQVGCPLACTFCATGKMGLKRNLTVDEIVDQVLFWRNNLLNKVNSTPSLLSKSKPSDEGRSKGGQGGLDVSRIVFMGMGEPFLNWDNLIESLTIINQDLGIGARKISISTAGIAPRIIDFASLNLQINLAVSLHSADQETRAKMMPIARQYSLTELKTALDYYTQKTHRQVFFEYLLASGINDSDHHLNLLVDFIKSNKLFYLNLIPLNPIKGGLTPSTRLSYFSDYLTKKRVNFSVRQSIGRSIDSACGQLIVDN